MTVEPPLRAAYVSPNQDSPSQFWAHRTMESPGMSPISSACGTSPRLHTADILSHIYTINFKYTEKSLGIFPVKPSSRYIS